MPPATGGGTAAGTGSAVLPGCRSAARHGRTTLGQQVQPVNNGHGYRQQGRAPPAACAAGGSGRTATWPPGRRRPWWAPAPAVPPGRRRLLQVPAGDAVPDPLGGGGQALLQGVRSGRNAVLVVLPPARPGSSGPPAAAGNPAAQSVQGILPGRFVVRAVFRLETGSGPVLVRFPAPGSGAGAGSGSGSGRAPPQAHRAQTESSSISSTV